MANGGGINVKDDKGRLWVGALPYGAGKSAIVKEFLKHDEIVKKLQIVRPAPRVMEHPCPFPGTAFLVVGIHPIFDQVFLLPKRGAQGGSGPSRPLGAPGGGRS